jgi:hypothetical protein
MSEECAPRVLVKIANGGDHMKRFAVIGAICASFLLGGVLSAVAQDDHHDDERRDDNAARQEEHHDQQMEHHDAREERRIDDAHWKQHFGRDHHFAIHHVNVVEGHPRFTYGGYTFAIVQPWPGGWSYNDNCYIDYVDGAYYLFDLRHPGVRIAVTIM